MVKTGYAFFLIIVCALFLRLPYLEVLPHWDWDEGVNQNIAWGLSEGRAQWFAIKYVWVPHPPLYFMVSAITLKTLGNTIYSMRLLSVAYSLLTTILVYLIGRQMADEKTGLLAALLYTIYPKAVYWNRMAFANNQLMFLSALTFYSLIKYFAEGKRRWFYLTCLTLGLSPITGFIGFSFLLSTLILFHWYRRTETVKTLALSISLFTAYFMVMLYRNPNEFIHDLAFHFGRFSVGGVITLLIGIPFFIIYSNRIKSWFQDYFHVRKTKIGRSVLLFYLPLTLLVLLLPPSDITFLDAIDYYWIVAILGFVFIEDALHRTSLWIFYLVYALALLGFNRADHMVMPAYPYLALGVGFFLSRLYDSRDTLFDGIKKRYGAAAASITASIIVFYPLAVLFYQDVNSFILKNNLAVMPLDEARRMNDFINQNVDESDLVLTYSYFTPYIKCTSSVLLQSIAYEGRGIAYYPGDFGPDRFFFNTSYLNAEYVVLPEGMLDSLEGAGYPEVAGELRRWRVAYRAERGDTQLPGVYRVLMDLRGVPIKYESLDYLVYENPGGS